MVDINYQSVKTIFYGYLFIVFLGAVLLMLPAAHTKEIAFIDALFTSASATSVTGLIVLSTSEDFTFFGEFVILSLIQIGGIGYMSLVTLFFLVFKNSLSMDEKKAMKHSLQ